MFYAYVIKSVKTDYLYKGHCECLETRIKAHNSGMTKSIACYIPFELKYFETFETREEAIRRERYFKTAAGRRFLKKKLSE
jgi:putative endonuclease